MFFKIIRNYELMSKLSEKDLYIAYDREYDDLSSIIEFHDHNEDMKKLFIHGIALFDNDCIHLGSIHCYKDQGVRYFQGLRKSIFAIDNGIKGISNMIINHLKKHEKQIAILDPIGPVSNILFKQGFQEAGKFMVWNNDSFIGSYKHDQHIQTCLQK